MSNHALILGGGMVGSTMAADLAQDRDVEVTVVDRKSEALADLAAIGVTTKQEDLSVPGSITRICEGFDVVLGALPSAMGQRALREVIESERPYCDISFMADDPLELDGLAKKHGVTAIVDCGVAPGMSNLLAGHAAGLLCPCESIAIYVGGLPKIRTEPFSYKAGFAPSDVLEEYTRPARMMEHGKVVVRPALGGVERLEFDGVGTVEAFETDGLRTLLKTLDVPDMLEKTIRYPGHAGLMRTFRETGLFSTEPVQLGDGAAVPLELLSALLFPKWTFNDREADLTVMRVLAVGRLGSVRKRLCWELIDEYDPITNTRSMSRVTAFPCTVTARALLQGKITNPGVHPPETLAKIPGFVDWMLQQLRARNVCFELSAVDLSP